MVVNCLNSHIYDQMTESKPTKCAFTFLLCERFSMGQRRHLSSFSIFFPHVALFLAKWNYVVLLGLLNICDMVNDINMVCLTKYSTFFTCSVWHFDFNVNCECHSYQLHYYRICFVNFPSICCSLLAFYYRVNWFRFFGAASRHI